MLLLPGGGAEGYVRSVGVGVGGEGGEKQEEAQTQFVNTALFRYGRGGGGEGAGTDVVLNRKLGHLYMYAQSKAAAAERT